MTPIDPDLERRRRGFWLRMGREHAGLSQESAARELGLSGKSKSTLSAWESGARDPRSSMLAKMARLYGIPVEMLVNPQPTAYEAIDRRLDELVRAAGELEREDWERLQAGRRAAEDEPDAELDRRRA